MTYCVGIKVDDGLVLASDSRTHAGVDNFAKFCKMTVFERVGERVVVLLSSGSLAGTQAVIGMLRRRADSADTKPTLLSAKTMFDAALVVSDAMREVDRRDGKALAESGSSFNASFVLGGQIRGEPPRLFRLYAEGNFIEASEETPYLQTGETKYGKPIIDRVVTHATTLGDAAKCVLVSFDSTMRSNLSVGLPIDLICYQQGSLRVSMRRRFDEADAYFTQLSTQWRDGVRHIFSELPEVP
jgi:putative proteasome-type protease